MPVDDLVSALQLEEVGEHRYRVLGAPLGGDAVAAWCFNEASTDWRADGIATTAAATAQGWSLTGTKTLVEAGAQADHLLVNAQTTDGLTQFLVPSDRAGVSITALRSLDFVRRFADMKLWVEASHATTDGAARAIIDDDEPAN